MNLDKKLKYVVACSFGPDSMALLNMMKNEKFNLVVAHVNYHKRKESDFEEAGLRKYCEHNNLELFVLDTKNLEHKGNFQDWARRIRYEFFKKVIQETKSDCLVVAHQQDDNIETYLMQKEKKAFVSWYGIKESTTIFDIKVLRPLLSFSKSELLDYNVKNNVLFSVDSSNLTNQYSRNKIRHEIVEKMSKLERKKILQEMQKSNDNNSQRNIRDLHKNIWELQDFLDENDEVLIQQISAILQLRSSFKILTKKFIKDVKKSFSSKIANVEIKLDKNYSLIKSYNNVYFVCLKSFSAYEYLIEKPGTYSFKFLDFEFQKEDHDRNISKDSFPIVIRPVSGLEKYQVGENVCSVRRLFIDWKVPVFLRNWWPGIYDRNEKLVYIPRYRQTYTDKHSSKFLIKFPQF